GAFGAVGGAITGATNATPIVVTTTSAHNLTDGDPIQITGIVGNTNANTTGFAKRTSYSATTFGLYSDAALTLGVGGNGAYTSGGAVSQALDVSAVLGDWQLFLNIEALTGGKRALVALEDSLDGFVNDVFSLWVENVQGGVVQNPPE